MTYHVPPRLCPPDAIVCPRCGRLQHQTYVGLGTHAFRLCEGKPNGTRCNAWLLIIRAGRLACVSAVTAEDKAELIRYLEGEDVAASA